MNKSNKNWPLLSTMRLGKTLPRGVLLPQDCAVMIIYVDLMMLSNLGRCHVGGIGQADSRVEPLPHLPRAPPRGRNPGGAYEGGIAGLELIVQGGFYQSRRVRQEHVQEACRRKQSQILCHKADLLCRGSKKRLEALPLFLYGSFPTLKFGDKVCSSNNRKSLHGTPAFSA